MIRFFAMLLLAAPAVASPVAALRVALEQAAGGPVRLDPRLTVPACPQGWQISARATALDARCPGQGWSVVVPVAAAVAPVATRPEMLVRRGSTVVVESGVAGIAARAEGIAEQDGAAGDHVRVRNLRSGARLMARVEQDGRLIANSR